MADKLRLCRIYTTLANRNEKCMSYVNDIGKQEGNMLVVCIRQWQIGRKYACRIYTTMVNRNKISLSYISDMRQHELKFACRVYTTSANQVTIKNYPSANRLGYKNKVSTRKGLRIAQFLDEPNLPCMVTIKDQPIRFQRVF